MHCDVIICGAGTAGLSAAIYCGRYGLRPLVLEKVFAGGQAAGTPHIENYPGAPDISGFELTQRIQAQAERFGAELLTAEVTGYDLAGCPKKIFCGDMSYEAGAVILAVGAHPRQLGLPNEAALIGHGVSYCAECDGFFYRGKTVCVVGGGDTAVQDALYLSALCEKVYLIHRREGFRAQAVSLTRLTERENVELVLNARVTELVADGNLTGVRVASTLPGGENGDRLLAAAGIFVAIGTEPNTADLAEHVALSVSGHIPVDRLMRTDVPGVFAAGDVVEKDLRQVVTAAADGALAAFAAHRYLEELR
ncbi:MAG: FAD-dependent oxidoreductase [Firmicutes bacterium]|nr:FAD-dependent oxidoreductase [Bacillota bacterium]